MKNRIIILIIGLFIFMPITVFANEKEIVKFSSCVDGDTIKVLINNKEEKVRFLAVDTPETKHPTKGEEPYGKEASNYTCDRVKNAKKLVLEYDDGSTKIDKYGRYLAWVYVDDSLLQAELIKNGLAEVAYLYGDYKYTNLLKEYEETARFNKVGKFSDDDKSTYTIKKEKNKNETNKLSANVKKKVKNELIKYISDLIDQFLDEIFK